MRTVYVDTGAFLAIMRSRDRSHSVMAEHLRSLRAEDALLVTSDAVIGETTTRLRYDAGMDAMMRFKGLLGDAEEFGTLRVRDSDAMLRRAAFALLEQYANLALSYADAMGVAVARDLRADAVFGLDNDFRVMGLIVEPG